jgi:hypothetical protein
LRGRGTLTVESKILNQLKVSKRAVVPDFQEERTGYASGARETLTRKNPRVVVAVGSSDRSQGEIAELLL